MQALGAKLSAPARHRAVRFGVPSTRKGRSKAAPTREPIIFPPFDDLSSLSPRRLLRLRSASRELLDLLEACADKGHHPVSDLVAASSSVFSRWSVYPPGGVEDANTGYAWFYHAHDPSEARSWEEHGHFHCFASRARVRKGARALAGPKKNHVNQGHRVHLAALSIDMSGVPTRIFATNRWVTGETMFEAGDVLPLVDQFDVRTNDRFQLTSDWLGVMLRLLRPTLAWVLHERDRVLGERSWSDPSGFSEDRTFEVASVAAIDVDAYLAAIDRAGAKKGSRSAA